MFVIIQVNIWLTHPHPHKYGLLNVLYLQNHLSLKRYTKIYVLAFPEDDAVTAVIVGPQLWARPLAARSYRRRSAAGYRRLSPSLLLQCRPSKLSNIISIFRDDTLSGA